MARKINVPTRNRQRLYDKTGKPTPNFNRTVNGWLTGSADVVEHKPPKAFAGVRNAYDKSFRSYVKKGFSKKDSHRKVLSNLTTLLFSVDINDEMDISLTSSTINLTGFRSARSQGMAKNAGENFINALAYALSDMLADQDEILVDKGMPPHLRELLTLKRRFVGTNGTTRDLELKVEVDLCIFSKKNPLDAIVISGKTRLKEVFHIGTMWKLFFDMIGDTYCLKKWGLMGTTREPNIIYAFATADMIAEGGQNTQGPDVGETGVRNLIALDASFFDYVFVSKTYPKAASHVSASLNLKKGREALFHEMGCLLDLVEQKFGLRLV